MKTFYDHRKGKLLKIVNGKNVESSVTYTDSPAPPNHFPKYADSDYQLKFSEFCFEVLAEANRAFKTGFVIDDCRLSDFSGAEYDDGNYVMYLVRRDKAGKSSNGSIQEFSNADYRHELRAFDSIAFFENNNVQGLRDMTMRALLMLESKI